ncbi:MAG TPA: hypothetical protein VGK59_22815 [Ohtaekwangia sp.]
MLTENSYSIVYKVLITVVVIGALLYVPVPLLPPHRLAEAIQWRLGIGWKTAYLLAAVGLQSTFYFLIGVLSAFIVRRAATWQKRLGQVVLVPVIVVVIALIIRSVKEGHFPIWINTVIPAGACFVGAWLGLGLFYRRGFAMLTILFIAAGVTLWGLSGGTSAELSHATEDCLRKLIASNSNLPSGEARFGAMLQVAFAKPSKESDTKGAVLHNRAAILALGIAVGDERLARFAGLENDYKLIQQVASLRKGTTLRKRHDWSRHFCLSAALAVLENPLVSDAGGLMKEQLDALTGGSGFSFGDVAADRAGVRFASAATNSEEDAQAMQEFLMRDFVVDNFLPSIADLPENLTPAQFREQFGTVGSKSYREKINEIEDRLNTCAALSPVD